MKKMVIPVLSIILVNAIMIIVVGNISMSREMVMGIGIAVGLLEVAPVSVIFDLYLENVNSDDK